MLELKKAGTSPPAFLPQKIFNHTTPRAVKFIDQFGQKTKEKMLK